MDDLSMRSSGFSLIEVMVVLLINSLLVTTIAEIYLHMKREFQVANALTDLNQQGRFVIYYLSKQIRMAGYSTCEAYDYIDKDFIIGYSATNLPSNIRRQAVADSEAILVKTCRRYRGKQRYVATLFYIGTTSRKHFGKKVLALYMKPLGGRRVELAPDVLQLHFQYKLGDLRYVTAEQVKDWREVRAVVIDVVMLAQRKNWPWYGYAFIRARKHSI